MSGAVTLVCEEHPWERMGHGGCPGAGAPATHALDLLREAVEHLARQAPASVPDRWWLRAHRDLDWSELVPDGWDLRTGGF